MTRADFCSEIESVQRRLRDRIDAIRRGESVYGTESEMRHIHDELARIADDVRLDRMPPTKSERASGLAWLVIDQFPWTGEPLCEAVAALVHHYRELE